MWQRMASAGKDLPDIEGHRTRNRVRAHQGIDPLEKERRDIAEAQRVSLALAVTPEKEKAQRKRDRKRGHERTNAKALAAAGAAPNKKKKGAAFIVATQRGGVAHIVGDRSSEGAKAARAQSSATKRERSESRSGNDSEASGSNAGATVAQQSRSKRKGGAKRKAVSSGGSEDEEEWTAAHKRDKGQKGRSTGRARKRSPSPKSWDELEAEFDKRQAALTPEQRHAQLADSSLPLKKLLGIDAADKDYSGAFIATAPPGSLLANARDFVDAARKAGTDSASTASADPQVEQRRAVCRTYFNRGKFPTLDEARAIINQRAVSSEQARFELRGGAAAAQKKEGFAGTALQSAAAAATPSRTAEQARVSGAATGTSYAALVAAQTRTTGAAAAATASRIAEQARAVGVAAATSYAARVAEQARVAAQARGTGADASQARR